MATLVFVGVYALGNPIDILISPDADQIEREQAIAPPRPRPAALGAVLRSSSKSALTGDLGRSFVHGMPAMELILQPHAGDPGARLRGAGPLGRRRHSARPAGRPRPHSLAGRGIMTGSILGFSLPNFWLGLMLILVFAVELGWLPAGGRGETARRCSASSGRS